jgi:hypothetical protein
MTQLRFDLNSYPSGAEFHSRFDGETIGCEFRWNRTRFNCQSLALDHSEYELLTPRICLRSPTGPTWWIAHGVVGAPGEQWNELQSSYDYIFI